MTKYEFASVAKGTLPIGDRWKLIKQLRNKDVYSRESAEYIASAITAEATAAAGGAPVANAFDLNALFEALDAFPADATAVVAVEDPVMAALAAQMGNVTMSGGRRGSKSRKSRKNKSRKSRRN